LRYAFKKGWKPLTGAWVKTLKRKSAIDGLSTFFNVLPFFLQKVIWLFLKSYKAALKKKIFEYSSFKDTG
jgi:hypothetical protein